MSLRYIIEHETSGTGQNPKTWIHAFYCNTLPALSVRTEKADISTVALHWHGQASPAARLDMADRDEAL